MTSFPQVQSPLSFNELVAISQAVHKENGVAEQRLRDKCRWEGMTRTAVIRDYGDPRQWDLPRV